MDSLLVLDLDRTLFDTSAFIEKFSKDISMIAKCDVELVKQLGREYSMSLPTTTAFSPGGFASFLEKKINIPSTQIEDLFSNNKEWYSSSLFSETISFLEKISKMRPVYLFSEGNFDNQTNKIVMSGIIKYFDPNRILIFANKLSPEAIASLPPRSTVVDDKLSVLEHLALHGMNPIWMNRVSQKVHPRFTTCFNLNDILTLYNMQNG